MPTHGALGLDGFNRLTDRARMHLLFEVCSSTIWARRVLAGGPFADVEALLDRADRVLARAATHSMVSEVLCRRALWGAYTIINVRRDAQ